MTDSWRDEGRRGVAAARSRLLVTRVGAMYRCVCGYQNVSLTAVEIHRTSEGPNRCKHEGEA